MFQKWYRSSFSSSIVLLVAGIACSSFVEAAPLPKLLRSVETKYARASTLSASFTQTTENPELGQKKVSSGKIYVKRPSEFRWETEKPDANLLVSNGKKVWYYTPPFEAGENGQFVERNYSEVQTRLLNALLSGSFSVTRDMKIRPSGKENFILTPKKGTAGSVTQATIHVDPTTQLIQKVVLAHRGGNKTEIQLTQIQLGEKLKDDLFSFTPPPHTDRINPDS